MAVTVFRGGGGDVWILAAGVEAKATTRAKARKASHAWNHRYPTIVYRACVWRGVIYACEWRPKSLAVLLGVLSHAQTCLMCNIWLPRTSSEPTHDK